jgi:hypothetical protein
MLSQVGLWHQPLLTICVDIEKRAAMAFGGQIKPFNSVHTGLNRGEVISPVIGRSRVK